MGKMKQSNYDFTDTRSNFDRFFEDGPDSLYEEPEHWLIEFENRQEAKLQTMYTLHQNCRAQND